MSYNESLNGNSNYPPMSQSEWDNAPWNQVDNPEREIEVTVSVTLSKTLKIKVSDYTVDSEGNVDYSDCNLREAVENQIILPQEAYKYVNPYTFNKHETIEDLSNWDVDDFEVILE